MTFSFFKRVRVLVIVLILSVMLFIWNENILRSLGPYFCTESGEVISSFPCWTKYWMVTYYISVSAFVSAGFLLLLRFVGYLQARAR